MNNASTKALSKSRYYEQYSGSCAVRLDVNRSMLSCRKSVIISLNKFWFSTHSYLSEKVCDVQSASTFNFPAMCNGEAQMFCVIHHSQIFNSSLFSERDFGYPMLLIYDTAVVSSIGTRIWVTWAWLQNEFGAKNAALSSKMLMWLMASITSFFFFIWDIENIFPTTAHTIYSNICSLSNFMHWGMANCVCYCLVSHCCN